MPINYINGCQEERIPVGFGDWERSRGMGFVMVGEALVELATIYSSDG